MHKTVKIAVGVAPLALLIACGSPDKGPAESGIEAGEKAAASLSDEVKRLAPEQTRAFQDALAAARAALAKQDFMAAREAAEGLQAKAKAAVDAAARRAEDLRRSIDESSARVGERLAALKARVAELEGLKKLPSEISQKTLAAAREEIAALEAEAARAKEQAGADAAAASRALKGIIGRAGEIADTLKAR